MKQNATRKMRFVTGVVAKAIPLGFAHFRMIVKTSMKLELNRLAPTI